jgi:hypothetical protein
MGLLIAVVVLAIAGCSEETRDSIADAIGGGSTTEAPPATEAPPDTEAPPTTEAPPPESDDEGSSAGAIVLIVAGSLILIGLLAAVLRRKPAQVTQQVTTGPPPAPSAGPTWFDRARMAYTDARWVYDNADTDLAVWRAAHGDAPPDPADTGRLAVTSRDLDQRVARTLDEFYRLEAGATDVAQRDAARYSGASLRSVQAALEARVAAHRAALGAPPEGDQAVTAAEAQADARLQQARSELLAALDRLPLAT